MGRVGYNIQRVLWFLYEKNRFYINRLLTIVIGMYITRRFHKIISCSCTKNVKKVPKKTFKFLMNFL